MKKLDAGSRKKYKENCLHDLGYVVFHFLSSSFAYYSSVHISSDEVFSKILKKPSIAQIRIIPHMKAKVVSIGKKDRNRRLKKAHFSTPTIVNIFFAKDFLWLVGLQ